MPNRKQVEANEAWERIADSVKDCGPEGKATLLVTNAGSRPNSGGLAIYVDVQVMRIGEDGRPTIQEWLSRNLATALGYRFNKTHEAIATGGFGYCRATGIVDAIAHKAGHPVRVESKGFFAGPSGWHPKQPVTKKAG